MLRIEATRDTPGGRTVALVGTVGCEYLPALEEAIDRADRDGRLLTFDLSQVRLAGREAVAFFASAERRRVRLAACPAYLREWLEAESRSEGRL